jgi:cytochrome P450
MTGILYLLLKNSDAHAKLKQEVRSTLGSANEINVASATKIPYLMAVLKEGMRTFPVSPTGAPRISPGVMVDDYYVPPGVSIATWSTRY